MDCCSSVVRNWMFRSEDTECGFAPKPDPTGECEFCHTSLLQDGEGSKPLISHLHNNELHTFHANCVQREFKQLQASADTPYTAICPHNHCDVLTLNKDVAETLFPSPQAQAEETLREKVTQVAKTFLTGFVIFGGIFFIAGSLTVPFAYLSATSSASLLQVTTLILPLTSGISLGSGLSMGISFVLMGAIHKLAERLIKKMFSHTTHQRVALVAVSLFCIWAIPTLSFQAPRQFAPLFSQDFAQAYRFGCEAGYVMSMVMLAKLSFQMFREIPNPAFSSPLLRSL